MIPGRNRLMFMPPVDKPQPTIDSPPTHKTVLRLLRDRGPMHRAELARRSGLSRTTVSGAVDSLMAEGLVLIAEEEAPSDGAARQPGRPGELLRLEPDAGTVIGVALSYHDVRVIATDLAQRPIAERNEPLSHNGGWEEDLRTAVRVVNEVLVDERIGRGRVVGVGLGVPAPLDSRRGAAGGSSSDAWLGAFPGDEFARQLGLPVALDNTARLSLLSEVRWGAGAGRKHAAYVKLSAGVGGGFLVDGRVLRGSVGAAGEVGHVSVKSDGAFCRCGGRGCLDAYASVPAVLEAVAPVFGRALDLPEVLDLLASGNRAVQRVFTDVGHLVGLALTGAANLLNPEVIIVGGELADAGDALIEPIAESVRRHAIPLVGGNVDIVPARLGAHAAAMGGIALVLREEDHLIRPG